MTRALIIGAGISGLAAAIGCAQQGIEVVVCERTPVLQPVGAGLTVAASAQQGLTYLGLMDRIDALAEPPGGVVILDWQSGDSLAAPVPAPHLAKTRRIARADLHRVLIERLKETGNAELRLGRELSGIDQQPGAVAAFMADGTAVEADFLIGADGARSSVRDALFGDGIPMFTGHIAWRFILPIEVARPHLKGLNSFITAGPRASLIAYTIGQGQLLNCVAITRTDEWAAEGWSEPGDPAGLAALFTDAHPDARAIIALAEEGNLYRWGLFDRPVTPSWSQGRAVLIGDAAHPVLPFLAYGAGLAIEDAVVLDRALALFDPVTAFRAFELERVPRATLIHSASRQQAEDFARTDRPEEGRIPPFFDSRIHNYDPTTVALAANS